MRGPARGEVNARKGNHRAWRRIRTISVIAYELVGFAGPRSYLVRRAGGVGC